MGSAAELDGRGELVCSPGFIDAHTHDAAALLRHSGLEFTVAQGCTSVVIGNCGFSGLTFDRGRHTGARAGKLLRFRSGG